MSQDVERKWGIQPGHFGDGIDNICIFENFIEPEDLKKIQLFCPTINKWNNSKESVYAEDGTCLYNADYWNDRMCNANILEEISPEIYAIVDKYIEKMKLALEDKFGVSLTKRPPAIVKWKPGTEQKPHADKQLNDGRINEFPEYDINSLFYYNDDFEGGELYYPQHDVVIKPKPGLAVAHPGDINYLHGVKMITSGFRYTSPAFFTVIT